MACNLAKEVDNINRQTEEIKAKGDAIKRIMDGIKP